MELSSRWLGWKRDIKIRIRNLTWRFRERERERNGEKKRKREWRDKESERQKVQKNALIECSGRYKRVEEIDFADICGWDEKK